ncbi:MAG: Nramp family divalent metal transporter [Verrucomicrobiae bacterium]|nr:Nramp family divalent metal transporter [Verrucomicrobiae bacterium]
MSESVESNPYIASQDQIADPPARWVDRLKYLGPGFILSASIVGSGELIMTTKLGAEAGFICLWVVLVSCLIKVTVQLEFGKHAIFSGETTFSAFNKLPGPKFGRGNWSIWVWLALMTLKFLQVGAIVGGVAIILNMAFPWLSTEAWTPIAAISVSLLVFRGYYQPIEKISIVMIGAFTVLTLVSVFMLQKTQYAVSWPDIASGMKFELPAAYVAVALGAFGITGVGGDEVMMYNYWLLEKGYAAKTGPRGDGYDPVWTKRAKGWIQIMYLDAILAMVAYTIVTMAFFVLGAAVLHAQGLVPESNELVETLSRMYTETLGVGAKDVFLAGAFVVLYSTLLSALAGWTRLFTDAWAQISGFDFTNSHARNRFISILAWVIPLAWGGLFLFFKAPGMMVMLGGIATAVILLIVLFAAIHFRYRRLPAELKPSMAYDIAFWISAFSIVGVGVYSVWSSLPKPKDEAAKPAIEENAVPQQAEKAD